MVDSRKVELIQVVFLDQTPQFNFIVADLTVCALSCVFICITIIIHSVSASKDQSFFSQMCAHFCNIPVRLGLQEVLFL